MLDSVRQGTGACARTQAADLGLGIACWRWSSPWHWSRAAMIFGGEGELGQSTSRRPGTGGVDGTLSIDAASEFDPEGDRRETGTEQLAVDCNPTGTAWSTEHYDTADFGGAQRTASASAIDAGETVTAKSDGDPRRSRPGCDARDLRVERVACRAALAGLGRPSTNVERRRERGRSTLPGEPARSLPDLDHQGPSARTTRAATRWRSSTSSCSSS